MSKTHIQEEIKAREEKNAMNIFKAFRKGEICIFDTIHEEFLWCNYELRLGQILVHENREGSGFVKYIFANLNLVSIDDPTFIEFSFDEVDVKDELVNKFDKFNCVLVIPSIKINRKDF